MEPIKKRMFMIPDASKKIYSSSDGLEMTRPTKRIELSRDLGAQLHSLKINHVGLMCLWGLSKIFSYLSYTAPLVGAFRKSVPALGRYISTAIVLTTTIWCFEKFITRVWPRINDKIENSISINRKKIKVLQGVYDKIKDDPSIPEFKSPLDYLDPWYTKPKIVQSQVALVIERDMDIASGRESLEEMRKLSPKIQASNPVLPGIYDYYKSKSAFKNALYKFMMTDFVPDLLKVCQNSCLDSQLIAPEAHYPVAVDQNKWEEVRLSKQTGIFYADIPFDQHNTITKDRPFILLRTCAEGAQGVKEKILTFKEFKAMMSASLDRNFETIAETLFQKLTDRS
ncbi:MAG: hypothetical protein FJZ61_03740 [Chlamydiae bacterium]|nr:hypothetical protein [Chlamydiota bacterium]